MEFDETRIDFCLSFKDLGRWEKIQIFVLLFWESSVECQGAKMWAKVEAFMVEVCRKQIKKSKATVNTFERRHESGKDCLDSEG